jgi:hypothetical protein
VDGAGADVLQATLLETEVGYRALEVGSAMRVKLEAAFPRSSLSPLVRVERRISSPILKPRSWSSSQIALRRRH